ncbi:MAG: glycosyltransferase family 4 protein [Colwellia sp.]
MKVNIVARPDHSLKMFEGLLRNKQCEDNVDLFTFYALRKGSFLNWLFPKLKAAPEQAITLDSYTLITRLSNMLVRMIGGNTRKNEVRLFKLLAPKNKIKECDILHYWPFYCADMAGNFKANRKIRTVAEYYEAEPLFVNDIYDEEYKRFNIDCENKINLMIDQNKAFEFENDFIVASEFTKRSYELRYPHKNYHVCKYGPAGYTLDDSLLSNSGNRCFSNAGRLVFVGQICVEKGVHYLLEAIKGMDVTLDLIGSIRTGQEKIFSELLQPLANVNQLGPMLHSEVLNSLSDYDAFCLPSLADNYSLAVVEALSKGKPVIVTENCGNADDVKDYHLGLVAKVKDAVSIRKCILELKSSFDYAEFNAGVRRFFSEENCQAYPKSVLDVYKTILERNNEDSICN